MSERIEKHKAALLSANLFASRCKEAIKRLEQDKRDGGYLHCCGGCRETAAARRASLELTLALADFRKP